MAEVESESWTQDEKIETGVETREIETKGFTQGKSLKATSMPFTSPRWTINRKEGGGNKASNQALQGGRLSKIYVGITEE